MEELVQNKVKHSKSKVPDGGWGWMIVLGATIVTTLIPNMHHSYGLMFSAWYNERGISSTVIAIIFNTNCVLWSMMLIFIGPLTDKYGWRVVGMISTFMAALSFILSAFATTTTHLLFSYSILGGVGGGLSVGQVIIILPKFFNKHLGVANAFPMAGFSIGQFIFPILMPFLQDQYGVKGSILILGGILLHAVAAAALFQPPEWHAKLYEESNMDNVVTKTSDTDKKVYQMSNDLSPEERRLVEKIGKEIVCILKATAKNFAILKKPSALIISLAGSLFVSSTFNFLGLVPFVIVNAGYSIEEAGWIMSYGAIANFLARLSTCVLSDFKWFSAPIGHVGGTFMVFIAMIGFALTDNILCLKIFSVMQGFGHGGNMGLFSIVTKEIVGPDQHSASIGSSGVMSAMGYLTIGPLLGLIRDFSGSYTATLLFMASLNALSVLLWFFMPLAKSYDKRQQAQ